ncbi:beta-glucosidase [Oxalobacteraceae bacterium OTU3REALA1]|nr:beta-glucosidase [Oxalobacteraceae bacterium OTU3REALA1]
MKKPIPSAMALAAALLIAAGARAGEAPATPEQRARALTDQLTSDEQFSLLRSYFPAFQKKLPPDAIIGAGYIPGVPRLGLPSLRETDAGMGVANLLNKRVDDVATSLPSALALAASWDLDLAYHGGAMIGAEARAKGFNVLLAGSVNLVRDPRNGRNFEYHGEDALLSGRMAGHAIRGVQSNQILSTVKHYVINDQETGRNVLSAKIGEAALRETDLLAFQLAIEIGKPAAVMCGYNRINGIYACEHDFLLNQVLKGDWGYPGWVQSDWGAVHSAAPAALAGLDHQSGYILDAKPYFGDPLKAAVAAGEVSPERIREMAYRIVRSMYATGLMDRPVPDAPQSIDYAAHAQVSEQAAAAGAVLLKNTGQLLPLAGKLKTIAVIGAHADIGVLSGGGSSQVRPVGGPALEIKPSGFASAFSRITYFPNAPLAALVKRMPGATIRYASGEDAAAAAELARTSDVAIVFAEQWTTEGEDVPNLALPGKQDELIRTVAAANPGTVVVLETGGPVLMPWLDQVGAVLAAWYPGAAGGDAIAAVLTGETDAAGRLPLTFPRGEDQLPRPVIPGLAEKTNAKGEVTYGLAAGLKEFEVDYDIEGADVGYRWFERTGKQPLFPFGYGLSYTSFGYQQLRTGGKDPLTLSFTVKNTGKRAGTDTPQVYMAVPGRDGKPISRLVGWGRVTLKPGESRQVSVKIDPRTVANFDTAARRWQLAPGSYQVVVGRHAGDRVLSAAMRLPKMSILP